MININFERKNNMPIMKNSIRTQNSPVMDDITCLELEFEYFLWFFIHISSHLNFLKN